MAGGENVVKPSVTNRGKKKADKSEKMVVPELVGEILFREIDAIEKQIKALEAQIKSLEERYHVIAEFLKTQGVTKCQ